ncbi:MAG: beta-galactosidase, partial [Saprospiraceae bacterium]
MKKIIRLIILLTLVGFQNLAAQNNLPRLEKIGNRYQLVVNESPFLMLGGELGNSTASTMRSMKPVWSKLKAMHLNTLLIPIYWELLEPVEGQFDYQLLDELILEARRQDFKLVLLWFGSWKNSMSSHVPAWVKLDQQRFPRAKSADGISQEILSPFSENNLYADLRAYQKIMERIRQIDAGYQTVILMQPENEIGMLPSARDYHPLATEKFQAVIPNDLMDYLGHNKAQLNPEFAAMWAKNGHKTAGTWESVFGKGLHTEEIFMAYYFAKYVNEISKAGKAIYALPTFVNAALNRPGTKPGDYPSAGPLPHILD